MRTYACELLSRTTKCSGKIDARFPGDAAELFCEALVNGGDLAVTDGEVIRVLVTVNGRQIKCNVTASVHTKIAHSFSAMEDE